MKAPRLCALLVCACISLSPVPALAQSSTGTVSGRVVDPSGAPITGAEVKLISETTRNARTLTSTDNGDFVFTDVQPGVFTITVKLTGFKQFQKSNLNLTSSDRLALGDLRLE